MSVEWTDAQLDAFADIIGYLIDLVGKHRQQDRMANTIGAPEGDDSAGETSTITSITLKVDSNPALESRPG